MARRGRLIKWTEQIGLMKLKYILIVLFLCSYAFAKAQEGWRKDSLQFKMYTRLYVNAQLQIDSINLKKVFCDYCSEKQLEALGNEALRQTKYEIHTPKYRKPGQHRLALYVGMSKADFKRIDE